MKVDINNIFTVLSLAFMLVGGIYKLAQIEANINTKISKIEANLLTEIDGLKDRLIEKFYLVEKRFDVHLQDYVNYKDSVLLQHNGTSEQVKHVWSKTEKLFSEQQTNIKDLQQFLQKQQDFRIRE